ncbi:MAG: hypothetical protein NTX45_29865 [Proteobacteria bacterium]|nr:hypothetical protein [Pseudomonadota bacterium]
MFLANSRYTHVATVETTASTGERVVALKLRRLMPVMGEAYGVMADDRLDLIAQAKYGDATQFWHVADANTALDSRVLTGNPGDSLNVPGT